MQSLLLKLQADIESRKRPRWDIAATARSALLGIALAMCAFLLGIRAAGRPGGGTLMEHLGAPGRGLVDRSRPRSRLKRVTETFHDGIPADLAEGSRNRARGGDRRAGGVGLVPRERVNAAR